MQRAEQLPDLPVTETKRLFLRELRFGFENWELNRIEGRCMLKNHAVARVLEKIGMTLEGILRKHTFAKGVFHDLKLYSKG